MYDKLMAAIAGGWYRGPVGPGQHYFVLGHLWHLRVYPDGGCYIDGICDPDAPDFLQAIIDKEHERALGVDEEFLEAIHEGWYWGPVDPRRYYLVETKWHRLQVHIDGMCYINGWFVAQAPHFLRAIIDAEHDLARGMNDVR